VPETDATPPPADTSTETTLPAEIDADPGLSRHQVTILLRLLRVAYPHPTFPDAPYERAAKSVQQADADHILARGLDDLDERAGGDFAGLNDVAATQLVEEVALSAFFKLVHATTVVALYDDHEVWDLLGYEGSSFDRGGYLDRGFDDLDWLPKPRIEEYDGESRLELVEGDR
jgi:hypothetical protein